MAVYQISKIQVRRGKKSTVTGIPQLASGEFAWAIDSQELYIGNGALSEGAPAIGNTKILTENDNIFQIDFYQYRGNDVNSSGINYVQTGPTPDNPIIQPVNSVLDRIVWAENFGIESNRSAALVQDITVPLQRAINELYLNSDFISGTTLDTPYRVELRFTPGVYRISSTIYLPSYVYITGSGINKTIFEYTGAGYAFVFIGDSARTYIGENGQFKTDGTFQTYVSGILSAVDTNSDDYPSNANLNNFSLKLDSPAASAFKLNAVTDSIFQDLLVTGYRSGGTSITNQGFTFVGPVPNAGESNPGKNRTCENNKFYNVTVRGFDKCVYSKYSVRDNVFDSCEFSSASGQATKFGIVLGGTEPVDDNYGPRDNIITNCKFKDIEQHNIHVISGYGNKSRGNDFSADIDVNDNYSYIKFDVPGNSSLHDTFDRYNELSNNTVEVYNPEVEGVVYHQSIVTKQLAIPAGTGLAARLPLNRTNGYKIEYVYRSNSQMRKGLLNVAVDANEDLIQLTDEYECIDESPLVGTNTIPSQQQQLNELLSFNGSLSNNQLLINYTNSTGEAGTLTFTYTVLVHN
jgi:hypothetical protein